MIKDQLTQEIKKTCEAVERSGKIALLNPEKPDGDSIGSAIALYLAFKKIGKEAKLYCPDKISERFFYLEEAKSFKNHIDLTDFDLIVSVDYASLSGFKVDDQIKNRKAPFINIDHHITNAHFGDINIVDPTSAAACEVVYGFLKELGIKIDRKIATALLTGLSTDTGSFRHSNTTPKVLQIASNLLMHGAKLNQIAKEVYYTKPIPALKLWGKAMSNLKFNSKLKIAVSTITKKDFEDCAAELSDLDGAVGLLASVPEAKATVLLSWYRDQIKGSLRTESDKIDLSSLAKIFGGGGHKKASGFTLDGEIAKNGDHWKIILK